MHMHGTYCTHECKHKCTFVQHVLFGKRYYDMQKYNTKVKAVTDVESWKNISIGRIYAKSTRDIKKFQLVVSPPEDPFLRNKYDASPLGTIDTDDVANVLPSKVVQMERCSDRFNVDFQYPVSAFVAFGICLVGGVPM